MDKGIYCICQTSKASELMITCDACGEWFNANFVNISENKAKLIKEYICIFCKERDPTRVTSYKTKRKRKEPNPNEEFYKPKKKRGNNKTNRKTKQCGECVGCYNTEDCGRCDVSTRRGSSKKKARCKQRISSNSLDGSRHTRKYSTSDKELSFDGHLTTDYPRQCYGLQCVNDARDGSKYCSDQCGLDLATSRILLILPQRLQEWALSPSAADEINAKALEQIRKRQEEVRQILLNIDNRRRELDVIVERAKYASIDPYLVNENEDDVGISMYCITCGNEIQSKTAIKHMEKCFNKYESQASYTSYFKSRIEENNVFCDFFELSDGTYCKKLRVLCSQHCKDPKVEEYEVCGCPLVVNVFSPTGEFCRAPKKTCTKHFIWEKLRRAEIDLERVQKWLKLEELLEKEQQIKKSMTNRTGVLPLMLHSTFNHELMERIIKKCID